MIIGCVKGAPSGWFGLATMGTRLHTLSDPDVYLFNKAMESEMNLLDIIKFDVNGLVTAIAQDAITNKVLMVAYMNRETLQETLATGKMVYYSRSRKKRWLKGETSGHFQTVAEVYVDCDGDALLFKIEQTGAACHEGYASCFFRKRNGDAWQICDKKLF